MPWDGVVLSYQANAGMGTQGHSHENAHPKYPDPDVKDAEAGVGSYREQNAEVLVSGDAQPHVARRIMVKDDAASRVVYREPLLNSERIRSPKVAVPVFVSSVVERTVTGWV